jgi:ATP-dependent DNA ligase
LFASKVVNGAGKSAVDGERGPMDLTPPYPPMEALRTDKLPAGDTWQYEPKWDGFRCLAFRDGDRIDLQSKSSQPLERYFPELVAKLRAIEASQFVLDSEIVVRVGDGFSFDQLQQRIHPAASRVKKLSTDFPATMIVFDLLADADGRSLTDLPLSERLTRLDTFATRYLSGIEGIVASPSTPDIRQAQTWLGAIGSEGMVDGVIAKRLDLPYQSGERTGMCKVKLIRTADCVIGGFRYADKVHAVGSLLLGLYEDGLLHHVGFTSGLKSQERVDLLAKLEPLIEPPGFTGRAPGGPSRWSTERSMEWQPLRTELVVEVSFDHFTGGRFRHGTSIVRWRTDKSPAQCTMDQIKDGSAGGAVLLR